MIRTDFGDCIGCRQPIRPPYLQFVVQQLEQPPGEEGSVIHTWGEVDVCNDCAPKLSVDGLHRLASAGEGEG